MASSAPILPIARQDIASSIASHQVQQFKQNLGIAPTLEELRRQKRQRRTWTVVVGAGETLNVFERVLKHQKSHKKLLRLYCFSMTGYSCGSCSCDRAGGNCDRSKFYLLHCLSVPSCAGTVHDRSTTSHQ